MRKFLLALALLSIPLASSAVAQPGLRHRDRDAADLALGVDLHHLLGAVGLQVQVCGKAGRLDEHVDPSAARGALQIAEDVAACLAPVAGDPVALAGDVAGEVELVAVAGAMQRLLQVHARRRDLVVSLATNAFGRAVGQRHRARSGPRAGKTGERTAGLRMDCGGRQHQCGADAHSSEGLSIMAGTKQFHCEFPIKINASLARKRLAASKV